MATAISDSSTATSGEWETRLDGFVQRARDAPAALRRLDQKAVDRIVWAMTVAGLEHAIDLAELAMEETHFGVLDDKQLNYLGDSQAAGIALGGRVPIALTSRPDTALERVASCALAVLVAQTQTRQAPA